jgi:hypothetical protein
MKAILVSILLTYIIPRATELKQQQLCQQPILPKILEETTRQR